MISLLYIIDAPFHIFFYFAKPQIVKFFNCLKY